ncbi:MAG: protein kinase [Planctomycetes bacterium]|nr:protein kinase [Planctomycetota bacterium]
MEFKVENMCGFLIRSKLMAPDEMQAMRARWLAEAKDKAAQVPTFLKWLVAKDYVTEYQASLLSRGHVDDFYLGDYKVLERIGRGRMAGVYKAVHPSGQVVAIKVLPPSRAKSGQTLARFQREARLSVKLKHPHVVRSFQVGETKGVHYLVMEYLEGETLEDVLGRRKRLPPAEAVRLIHQALLGLQHINEMGMVHRDLKPANLMLLPIPAKADSATTLKSNVKILDIGLAREFFDEKTQADATEKMELTGEGTLLGTPDYLAPEQARDPRNIDIRADIYSLGCTLYHLLTGQPPFPDKNILNQMIRHATEAPKPLQDFVPALPEGLSQIVNWMMAKQPGQRYPTPARAAQALDAFLMVTSEPARPVEETPQLRKYLTWLEINDKDAERTNPAPPVKPPSSPNIPVASARPPSGQSIPVAPPKPKSSPSVPVASAKPAAPEKKRKKRTGVKVPGPAPDPEPITVAMPAPPPANPLDFNTSAPAAAPMPAALPADQFDVELVDIPTPAKKGFRPTLRDLLMAGIGVGVTLVAVGFCWIVSLAFR